MKKTKCPDCEMVSLEHYQTTKQCHECGYVLEPCQECGEMTDVSHYREDDGETVCEDCYIDWLKEQPQN